MRTKFLAVLLLFLVVIPLPALAADNFLYGIQIFNRPIDWYWGNFTTKAEGVSVVRKMAELAADAGFDIARGGPEFSNMYSQLRLDSEREMWGLKELLPIIAENNLMLDWVITGANAGIGISNPPELSMWSALTGIGAGVVTSATGQPKVIYEIWNEPDLPGAYWQGSCAYYYDTFLPAAYSSIRQADTGAQLINGGLVLGNTASDARDYLSRAITALNNGTISMLAIHSHNTLDEFLRLWNEDTLLNSVDPSKIFLNEVGFSRGDNNTKAFQSIGKMLAAKRMGLAGVVLFHMGGLKSAMMNDLQDGGYYYSYMTSLNANNEPEPNEIYYSAKTAITHTKGLAAVSTWPLTKKDGAYTWLFQNDDGRKTLVYLNGDSGHPSDSDIAAAFGSDSYDAVYNMTGSEVTHGTNSTILYYVKNSTTPQTPQTITILTESIPAGRENEPFSFILSADTEGVTWTYTGNFPAGLKPYADGLISGTPTESGTFDFTATASKAGMTSASKHLTITITPSESNGYYPAPPTILTTELASGRFGETYSFTMSSDREGITWRLEGDLPEGLTFDTNTGTISGTPEEYGEFPLIAYVTADGQFFRSQEFTLVIVAEGTIIITTTQADFDAAECSVNKSYSLELKSTPDADIWRVVDSELPSNLGIVLRRINSDSRRVGFFLRGTPTQKGTYTFKLQAEADGWESASQTFTLHVDESEASNPDTPDTPDTPSNPSNPSTTNNPGSSSGGGGCSYGFGAIALISACLVLFSHAEHHSRS